MSAGRKVYLVVRKLWSMDDCYRGGSSPTGDERIPVRGFANKKDAEALCLELEREFRLERDVWTWFGGGWVSEQSEAFKAAAVRLGLVSANVEAWPCWEQFTSPPTPEQRAALWAAVPRCQVFEVIESKLFS
jgi:hypothetical protein